MTQGGMWIWVVVQRARKCGVRKRSERGRITAGLSQRGRENMESRRGETLALGLVDAQDAVGRVPPVPHALVLEHPRAVAHELLVAPTNQQSVSRFRSPRSKYPPRQPTLTGMAGGFQPSSKPTPTPAALAPPSSTQHLRVSEPSTHQSTTPNMSTPPPSRPISSGHSRYGRRANVLGGMDRHWKCDTAGVTEVDAAIPSGVREIKHSRDCRQLTSLSSRRRAQSSERTCVAVQQTPSAVSDVKIRRMRRAQHQSG